MGLSGSVRDLEAAGQHVAREFGTKAHGCKTNHGYVREISWASLQHQPECNQNGRPPHAHMRSHTYSSHFLAEFHTDSLCFLFFIIFCPVLHLSLLSWDLKDTKYLVISHYWMRICF